MAEIPKPGSIPFEDRAIKKMPYEWGFGSTPRTAKLREELKWKAASIREWADVALGIGKTTFREGAGIKADVDRARLVTKAYKETEEQPWVIRRANMMKRLCEEMPIFIKPGELIVGDPNSAPDEVRWYPENSVHWMPEAVTTGGFSDIVTDAERKEIIEDICEYWKDKSIESRIKAVLPEDMWPYIVGTITSTSVANIWEEGLTLLGYDYDSLFKEGLRARIDRAEASLKELETKIGEMKPSEYVEKKNNWEAMAICGRAIIRFAQRHAELAREQAKAEKDETRKKELEEMAAILDWVPANPPRTFHECLQFYWIVEVTGKFLMVQGAGCGVRIDQVWWPYYEADIKAERITREKALELVECLFLKIQEVGVALDWPVAFTALSGGDIFYTAEICGSKD